MHNSPSTSSVLVFQQLSFQAKIPMYLGKTYLFKKKIWTARPAHPILTFQHLASHTKHACSSNPQFQATIFPNFVSETPSHFSFLTHPNPISTHLLSITKTSPIQKPKNSPWRNSNHGLPKTLPAQTPNSRTQWLAYPENMRSYQRQDWQPLNTTFTNQGPCFLQSPRISLFPATNNSAMSNGHCLDTSWSSSNAIVKRYWSPVKALTQLFYSFPPH